MNYERIINYLLDRIEQLEKEKKELTTELHNEISKQMFKKLIDKESEDE